MDLPDGELLFFRGKKGISVKVIVTACGSTTFCRVECKQNVFRKDIAIVQISNIVQNARPIPSEAGSSESTLGRNDQIFLMYY